MRDSLKKKVKKAIISLLAVSSIFSLGSCNPANASKNVHKSWHWEESLSIRRANHNIDKSNRSNKIIRRNHNRVTYLYKDLRKYHYSNQQSIIILSLAYKSSSLNNLKLKKLKGNMLPTYGYFKFLGHNKNSLVKFAKYHHLNPNDIATQFKFLQSSSNYKLRTSKLNTSLLARRAGKKLFVVNPFSSNKSARQTINHIKKQLN